MEPPAAPGHARPPRRLARTRLATALALVSLALAGCGSGDGASSSTSTTSVGSTSTSPSTTTAASPTTKPAITTTTAAPTDEAQIRAAYVAFFDGATPGIDKKVALLENGEKYRQMLVDASANVQFQKLSATVRTVTFPADTACAAIGATSPCANVTFDLLVGGFPALAAHEAPAVKIAGVWKVAAKAWCDVVMIGGDSCPS
jgi:hypothetical protein